MHEWLKFVHQNKNKLFQSKSTVVDASFNSCWYFVERRSVLSKDMPIGYRIDSIKTKQLFTNRSKIQYINNPQIYCM